MTSPTGSQRPLFYPLNTTEDQESDTPNTPAITHIDLSNWSTNDPDLRVPIVIKLSLNEYVALASSVDVGRDIAYGDNSLYIWWIWTRMLESMTICDDVYNCIETVPELQALIQQTVNGNPNTGGQQSRIDSLAFDVDDCNEDAIYGYSKALWEYINASTIDALQLLSEETNLPEQISKFITSIIPGAEVLPIDEILGWFSDFGNYNLEAYEASITVGLEQEIICDIFCMALNNNCSLDFGQVYDYFVEKLGGVSVPNALANLSEWIFFMATGTYPSDKIVYLWSAFQLALAFMGQKFLGVSTISRYALIAQSGIPDDAWATLCTDCVVEWEWTSNFSSSVNIWSITNNGFGALGTWSSGSGYHTSDVKIGNPNIYARILSIYTSNFDTTITRIEFDYSIVKGSTNGSSQTTVEIRVTKVDNSVVFIALTFATTTDGTFTLVLPDRIEHAKSIRIQNRVSNQNSASYSGSGSINQLRIYGEDDNPFV